VNQIFLMARQQQLLWSWPSSLPSDFDLCTEVILAWLPRFLLIPEAPSFFFGANGTWSVGRMELVVYFRFGLNRVSDSPDSFACLGVCGCLSSTLHLKLHSKRSTFNLFLHLYIWLYRLCIHIEMTRRMHTVPLYFKSFDTMKGPD